MSAIPADLPAPVRWRPAALAMVGVLAVLLGLYHETAASMVAIWSRSDTFAHGFLVPPISAWLVWRQRAALAAIAPRPSLWALPLLLVAGLLWAVSELAVVNAARQFALVALVVLAVPAVLGTKVAQAILFPLLFLFFAVPFGEFTVPVMMEWTADFTVAALRLSGIPVYREGLEFVIPSGNWSVVEACSGVRYLIASFMVGTLFAYLNFRSARRRLVFIAASIVVPIIANWVRAYMIVMLGHLSGNTIAVGVDHLIYGWVFFGLVVLAMFAVGARWADADDGAAAPHPARGAAGAGRPARVGPAALLVLAIAAAPAALVWQVQRAGAGAAAPLLALPDAWRSGWAAEAVPLADWSAVAANPSARAARTYAGPAGRVMLDIAYYRAQDDQRKLVSSSNMLLRSDDRAWNRVAAGRHPVALAGGGFDVRTARIAYRAPLALASGRQVLTVWRVYWVDGRFVASDAQAKLHAALASLRGRGDDGAIVVLATDVADEAAATAALTAFLNDNAQALDALLQGVRSMR